MPNPVLLVHGFTTSADRTWREPGWIDLLADAGRTVIAPNLLGHGDAPKPHDVEAYAEVESLVAAELPDRPVDAIGYSAGAGIVLRLAAERPERFDRIVLGGIGAGVMASSDGRRSNRGQAIASALEGTGDPNDVTAQHFKAMAESDGNDPAALAAFIKRPQPALGLPELARIDRPILVVIGEHDFAGPAEPLVEALPSAELLSLPRVDHFGLPKAFAFVEQALAFIGADPLA